jgi:hypothetical protein
MSHYCIINSENDKNRLSMVISQQFPLHIPQLCTIIKKICRNKIFSPQGNVAILVNNGQVQRISFQGV